ncbi:kazrin isoform X3 [Folsomia candida]|uniref:Kazrin n=1 Tax=Folsomia candida TaxID=158441 RepID=A0A226EJS3_FOLCA|nr:kazrin isoform X3 [Folsomia candida]OXA56826.1 Kazrin [Folsomia candida]
MKDFTHSDLNTSVEVANSAVSEEQHIPVIGELEDRSNGNKCEIENGASNVSPSLTDATISADNSICTYKSESDEDAETTEPTMSAHQGKINCKIVTAFTRAFAKQNIHFENAIQSLSALNEQILICAFPNENTEKIQIEDKNGDGIYRDAVKVSLGLMRGLLLDAQGKFRKMVEENKSIAYKLDGDLQIAHSEMALLRAELHDTNKRISQLNSPPSTPSTPNHDTSTSGNMTFSNTNHSDEKDSIQVNGLSTSNGDHNNHDDSEQLLDLENLSLSECKEECKRLVAKNQSLQKEMWELNKAKDIPELTELRHAKEALLALKGDRKRLKAEKFELLNQMKQLYSTLEDKEKELRDFIRNYEQNLQRLTVERDEAERERWSILRHARDEAERGLALAAQLNVRESQVQQMQQEVHEARRQLAQYGIYSEADRTDRSSTTANSHYSLVSSLTATYATVGGDRGSSADSGVRLSSDRDSGAGGVATGNLSDSANEAISLDLGDGSGDGDSMSVISTATLPQLFTTPRDSPGLTFASLTRSLDTNPLSRSAEQLLAAEAAEARRKNSRRSGNDFAGRASTGAKGAWGSISRVFARNKHRRTLDSSLFEGLAANQRTSWSPQGSVSQSPLTEQESYADKLAALEEAATLPMELWRACMVQAWIEVSLGMPQYGSRCADNVKSGKVLLELADVELETELGILHPLHRKKLRLAIEEHRNPALVRFPCIAELSHVWVSSEWLPDIGLPQYAETFAGCLVDARLLDHMSKKDLEKFLGVTKKFHMASIAHGVHLLRIVGYDRQALAERRRHADNDPIVWTNQHFVQWARSIDLGEYSENLKGSGVHGAICVLEPSFNGETLASAMGIPPNKQIIRRHLCAELEAMLSPARAKITQQYRMTKSRAQHMLDKQRSDSLGRSAALTSEAFRRSTEDNRRRTSLRGSLSRALGIKIKQDLLHRREDEKRKSEDRDQIGISNSKTLGPVGGTHSVAAHFFSPPAPPLPAKFIRESHPAHTLNFDHSKFMSTVASSSSNHHPRERPHSVLTMSTTTPTGRDELSERDSESESRDSSSNSMSQSNSESHASNNVATNATTTTTTIQITQPPPESLNEEETNGKPRRIKSTTDNNVETVSIHTPV